MSAIRFLRCEAPAYIYIRFIAHFLLMEFPAAACGKIYCFCLAFALVILFRFSSISFLVLW
jgi:hypothetical protein